VILVVEDDALLRMVAAGTLEDHGFRAVEAANADAALELLGTRDDVRLLFTDIQMPGSCVEWAWRDRCMRARPTSSWP
jgi:CheY-like chemotaxis protein